jgi:hypothetical protein
MITKSLTLKLVPNKSFSSQSLSLLRPLVVRRVFSLKPLENGFAKFKKISLEKLEKV